MHKYLAAALIAALTVLGLTAAPAQAAFTNGGLETGAVSPWTGNGPTWPTLSVVTTPVHSGTKALRASLPVLSAGSHTGVCSRTTLSAGTTYTLSAWARGDVSARLRVNSTQGAQVAPAGSTWTKITWTWTQGTTVGSKVCVVTDDLATTAGKNLYVDDVTLTTGTPSLPAPTDPKLGTLPKLEAVNKAGTEYACAQGWGIFDGPHDQAVVNTMKSWGINAVRVPLNEHCWLGVNGVKPKYGGTSYQTAIRGWTDLLRANGLYVILDLHWSAPGTTLATRQNNMADMDHSPAFWTSVANTYKADTGVLFDLYNEPHGITWSQWKNGDAVWAGMDDLIAAVRSTGSTNWVIASGLKWGNDASGWLANKPTDSAGKLAAGAHVYNFNACASSTCWDANYRPVAQQVPLVITEMGEDRCAHAFVDALFAWSDANGVDGYAPWGFNTSMSCAGGPGLISDNTGKPTPYGQGVRDHYLAH